MMLFHVLFRNAIGARSLLEDPYKDNAIGLAKLIVDIATANHEDVLGSIKRDTETIIEGKFKTGLEYLESIKHTDLSAHQIDNYYVEAEKCFRESLGMYDRCIYMHPIMEFYIGLSIMGQRRKDKLGLDFIRRSLINSLEHLRYAMYYSSILWNKKKGELVWVRRTRNLYWIHAALVGGAALMVGEVPVVGWITMGSAASNLAIWQMELRKKIKYSNELVSPQVTSLFKKMDLIRSISFHSEEIAKEWNDTYFKNSKDWYASMKDSLTIVGRNMTFEIEGSWDLDRFSSRYPDKVYIQNFKKLSEKLDLKDR